MGQETSEGGLIPPNLWNVLQKSCWLTPQRRPRIAASDRSGVREAFRTCRSKGELKSVRIAHSLKQGTAMIIPKFAQNDLKVFRCPNCRQNVTPENAVIVRGGISKRPQMPAPRFDIGVECPHCGAASSIGLSSLEWPEVISWVLDMATSSHVKDQDDVLVAACDVPKDRRVWVRTPTQLLMFELLGGFKVEEATYLVVRRVPLRIAGWDGRSWHRVIRTRKGKQVDILDENDPHHFCSDDWQKFQTLGEGHEFRVGGCIGVRVPQSALRKFVQSGTLTCSAQG